MEDKQRLFKVIQRLNAEEPGTSAMHATQLSDRRRASNGRQADRRSYDSSARTVLEHDLLDNNNLLDLDDIDGSGDFLSPVSKPDPQQATAAAAAPALAQLRDAVKIAA